MLDAIGGIVLHDMVDEALAGLSQVQKTLPAKFFYDEVGCRLFGAITELPEYYVTRTERALLLEIASDVGKAAPSSAALVEYGASMEDKALLILAHMHRPQAYVPIDVAEPALDAIANRMASQPIAVYPVAADFLAPFVLPDEIGGMPVLGFFPGSTIGNFEPALAAKFMAQARATLGEGAMFLVGVDLRKDPAILIPAYDDAAGVTAAFNRNVLVRLNKYAGANFIPRQFAHEARWNDRESRIEMHLVSDRSQDVVLAGHEIHFEPGESIHTENSYKHTVAGFQALAAEAGWGTIWARTDEASMFSLHLLRAEIKLP